MLIEHNGQPYLNSYVGSGAWSTVNVIAGEWAEYDVQNTADATF